MVSFKAALAGVGSKGKHKVVFLLVHEARLLGRQGAVAVALTAIGKVYVCRGGWRLNA